MEVPCCTGLLRITEKAVALAQSELAVNDITISLRGEVLSGSYTLQGSKFPRAKS